MHTPRVLSREYKVTLRTEAFDGAEDQLLKTASNFWREFTDTIEKTIEDKDGNLDRIVKSRTIRFYDTEEHLLNKNSYIFRERRDRKTAKREVTLKFRHLDRYISQDRNMKAAGFDEGRTKFEEDIKAPFVILYSFSTTREIRDSEDLKRMKDLAILFPDLRDKLDRYEGDDKIRRVNGFTAKEVVIGRAKFQIGKRPRVDSECALIFWYDDDSGKQKPLVGEFSFRYGRKDGEYERDTAYRSYRVFEMLQKLTSWVDLNSKTKTGFIYA
jgi:hypothetical protein